MRSLSSDLTAAKNAWEQPSPWLWMIEVEYDDWWMVRYKSRGVGFSDGAAVTCGGTTGTIVVHIPTTETDGFIIVEDTSGGTFTSGVVITDAGGGTAMVDGTVNTTDDPPVIFRFVRNTEHIDYTYEDETYDAMPFTIGTASFAKNQFRGVDITFSNAFRAVESFVRRANGLLNARVTLKVIWTGDLTQAPAFEQEYEVKKTSVNNDSVTMTCGQENFLLRGYPRFRFNRKRCRWRFKSASCGYAGASTACNRYIDGCIASSNTSRFGGFPGIPGGAFSY